MQAIIFDLEIAKAIPDRNQPNLDGIEYCEGWGDHKGMGIACVGYAFYGAHQLCYTKLFDDFAEVYKKTEGFGSFKKIGFNSKAFDDKVLRAAGITDWYTDYDLLCEVRIAAGHSPTKAPSGWKYNLEALAMANGMIKDAAVSAAAPILWQQGHQQQVFNQCSNDVSVTAALLDLGLAGELIDPNTGNKLKLRAV